MKKLFTVLTILMFLIPSALAMPNPASVYCVEQGGKSIIKTNPDGSQYGVCSINGQEIEEWKFYREKKSTYGSGYWHSNDYYNVELSGNGNAFVVATMNLESLTDKNVSSIVLEIPNYNVQIYKLVQSGGYYYNPLDRCGGDYRCGPNYPIYYEPEFLNYTTETLASSTVLRIDLAHPLMPTQQNTIYLVYSTPKIAKETFQGFGFSFKTVQDPNALIRYVSASVSVPENMELKGKPKFDINYRSSDVFAAMSSGSAKQMVESIRYPGPYYGGSQYSAQNLMPGESFTVSGLYGSNFWLLYVQEIVWGLVIIVAFLFVFYFFLMGRVRKVFERRFEGGEVRRRSGFSFGRALLTGMASGFIFVVAYFALTYFSGLIYSYNYYSGQPTVILFFLLNAGVLIVSLFGLPYWIGRRNRSEGIVAGIIGIFAALVLLIVISMIFPTQPPIIYFAENILGGFTKTQTTQVTVPTPELLE
ncbi:MAG: DUF333 domain-containing protein [Candidatus Aenigmatarchaeota archaeon]